MKNTDFEPTPAIRPALAKGYEIGADGRLDADTPAREHEGRGYKVPNGAVYTTVEDLARFVAFELGEGPESVLPRKAWLENLSRVNSADGNLTSGYGIGFQVSRSGEFVSYGHGDRWRAIARRRFSIRSPRREPSYCATSAGASTFRGCAAARCRKP